MICLVLILMAGVSSPTYADEDAFFAGLESYLENFENGDMATCLMILQELEPELASLGNDEKRDMAILMVSGGYAALRHYDEAQRVIDAYPESDNAYWMAQKNIFSMAVDNKDFAIAEELLAQLPEVYIRDWAAYELVTAYCEEGRLIEAAALADRIGDPKPRNDAYVKLAQGYCSVGDTAAGLALLEKLDDSVGKDRILRQVAASYRNQGAYAQALDIIVMISNSQVKDAELSVLCRTLLDEGHLDTTMDVVDYITDEQLADQLHYTVGNHYFQRGEYERGFSCFALITDESYQHHSQESIKRMAFALAEAGDTVGLELVSDHLSAIDRNAVMERYAELRIWAGDITDPKELEALGGDAGSQAEMLAELAAEYTSHGELEQAYKIADGITDENSLHKANVIGYIASEYYLAGDNPRAFALLQEAEMLARRISAVDDRVPVLAYLAYEYGYEGHLPSAVRLADEIYAQTLSIRDPDYRDSSLENLATAYTAGGAADSAALCLNAISPRNQTSAREHIEPVSIRPAIGTAKPGQSKAAGRN